MLGKLSVLAVLAALTTGCNWYAKAGKNDQQGVWVEAGVSGSLNKAQRTGIATLDSFDASDFVVVLETSGATVTTTSGQALVTLYNGPTLLASRYFGYYNNAGTLVASDPASIEAWASAYPSATDIKFGISGIATQATGTEATLMATSVYEGEPVASASTSWRTGRTGGCREVRCHEQ